MSMSTDHVPEGAVALRPGGKVIHADLGEVTVREVGEGRVLIADDNGETEWVPASEIC